MTDSPITRDMLTRCLPPKVHNSLSDLFIDSLNSNITDPNFREVYSENLLGFGSVLKEGKFRLQSYVDAVKFVSYKLLGSTDVEGYARTFPDRYQRLKDAGTDARGISSYVYAYKNKNQIVAKVFEQTMMPTYVVNADLYQKAINVQAELMMSAKSEKVRSDAAGWIMKELKAPEVAKLEVEIATSSSVTDEYEKSMLKMVRKQQELIAQGASVLSVANAEIKVVNPEVPNTDV
jgi:hypothetical protein